MKEIVLGTRYQQEVHLDRLFADVADYDLMVTNPQQMPLATVAREKINQLRS